MKESALTAEERATLASYRLIAGARSAAHDMPEFWRPEFERFARLLPSGHVLDVGCGSGRDVGLFLQGGYAYTGIDLCDEMLALARLRAPQADFRQMDMYGLEFLDGSFDGFWAVTSLLHLPKSRVDAALGEMRRVTVKGGAGLVIMKEGAGERMVRGPFDGDERFYAFYTLREFRTVLKRCGFTVLEAERDEAGGTPPNKPLVWLKYFVRTR